MSIIKASKMGFNYIKYSDDDTDPEMTQAIDSIDLKIEAGQFIAVLGHNGSGKSTLAKHINALLQPTSGTMWIDGINTNEEEDLWKIRQKAGMVFQNPDNQIIGTVVEEDVGFGPENIGIRTEDIWTRVEDSLEKVGMLGFREKSPNRLSGGQKQRVAIAGVVAMHPECIVLDEPTAMLDPNGRAEVLQVLRELNKKEGVTIILITHYMEEVVFADDVYIMDKGNIVMHGTPREVFSQVEKLKSYHLDVPQITDLAHELKKCGVGIPDGILTIDELEKALEGTTGTGVVVPDETAAAAGGTTGTGVAAPLIELKDVCYTYGDGTVYEVKALDHVSLKIYPGEFIGLIGHTGSGKSTLVQHLNGLIEPTSGQVLFEGKDIRSDGFDLRHLRTQVGLVFQYPEHQLFETDVLKDVCFGPKNEGLSQEEAVKRATHALRHVGVPEEMYKESPFEISGGQKRRVAIAGVLAMDPKVLILDEPTAGLDPQGRDEILDRIKYLQVKRGITIVLVTHSMEDAAMYADRLVVMNDAKVVFDDKPRRVFSHFRELEKMGLAAPQITYLMNDLKEHGFDVDTEAMTVAEATETILKALKNKTEQKPEDGSLNSGDK
ncbi:MAG: energy-coupling factor transporter ATPase [Lachnospiraceae bacterium]|nr:energy-coupling factor transporter ATPase [Lachnospiraceae bacterium]MCI1727197.1 energy-coupling factor transporter ATPase [Lachnospiraceae bacterium]